MECSSTGSRAHARGRLQRRAVGLCARLLIFSTLVVEAQFLPPLGPAEYSYSLKQTYLATTVVGGTVLNDVTSTASQYWSLAALSTRGLVSSGPGIDKGLTGTVVNRLTVTNYTNAASGSLVTDLVDRRCDYFGVEGGASYPGPDAYRTIFAASLASPATPTGQYNESNWVHDGVSYGPVNIWWQTPPTGVPNRTLQYTLVFPEGSNELLGYLVNGTESLPNCAADPACPPVVVTLDEAEIRTGYEVVTSWPADFFSTEAACLFGTPPPPPPPVDGCYDGGLHTNSTGVWATGAAICAFAGILLGALIGAAVHKQCASRRPKRPPGELIVGGHQPL